MFRTLKLYELNKFDYTVQFVFNPPSTNNTDLTNNHAKYPTKNEIRTMLEEINYVVPNANLGNIVRKNIRNE